MGEMSVEEQIEGYLVGLVERKRGEMVALHEMILGVAPGCRLWFSDGRNEEGKVVANPTIGYGVYTARYADGSEKEAFRVGLSGNSTGISVYVMGLEDKGLLVREFGGGDWEGDGDGLLHPVPVGGGD